LDEKSIEQSGRKRKKERRPYIPGLKRRGFTARMVSSKEKQGKVE
jgi:hypothetical protein